MTDARSLPAALVGAVVALQLATLLPYAASGLLAPPYAVVVLLAVWVALTVLAAVVLRRRGARALLVPLLTVVVRVAALTAGDLLLGWTA